MTVAQWIFLSAATVALVRLSRRSLARPRSHGFHRFFALEATAALLALNGPAWFADRYSPAQLASWLLLVVSLYLLIDGLRLLRRHGLADPLRHDPTLLGFERTRDLVAEGMYARIRHPLYASVILLAWGVALKAPSATAIVLALAATGLMAATARVEEHECLAYFGDTYGSYMRRTRMFVPWIL